MTAPKPRRPLDATDAPPPPAVNIAEQASLVPVGPASPPQPLAAAAAGTVAAPAVGNAAHPAPAATPPWGRAALALAIGGSVLALGTRALFERVMGPVPYDLPSNGVIVAAVTAASGLSALLVSWTSTAKRPPGSKVAAGSWSSPTNASLLLANLCVVLMLNGAYTRAGEIDTSSALDQPLTVLERRAELRPANVPAQYRLGLAYYRAGRYLDAARSLEYVRELAKSAGDVRGESAAGHPDDGEIVRRADVYARATALSVLARAHLAAPDAALDLYRKAYETGGPSAEVSRALYDALMNAHLFAEASNVAGEYLRLHQQDAAWYPLYRAAWDAAQNAERASMVAASAAQEATIARFREEARRAPDDAYPEAYLAYAAMQTALGTRVKFEASTFDSALVHARRAVALAPGNADYQAQLGLILTFGNHWISADRAFTAAVAADPHVLGRHDGFEAAWQTARARMRGERGPGVARFMLEAPRRP